MTSLRERVAPSARAPARRRSGRSGLAGAVGAALLLAMPTVLAFFSGGFFFDAPASLVAGLVAWALVGVAALTCPVPLPRTRAGRLAVAGLAALLVWTIVSVAWSPLADRTVADALRLGLYLGVLLASAAFLRGGARGAAEPALALGAVVVLAYGLSERFLPGVVTLDRSVSAAGRLEQPLTYWNAMGLLGAIGLVLVLRLASDPDRGDRTAAAAAAAAPLLALGVLLTLSRGALAAVAAGVLALVLLAPGRAPARALGAALACAVLAAMLGLALPSLRTLEGGLGRREAEGAAALAGVVVLGAAAALAVIALRRRERGGLIRGGELWSPGRRRRLVVAAVVVAVAAWGGAALIERGPLLVRPEANARVSRLATAGSERYEYWRVALLTWAEHPALGVGSGAFVVPWLQNRHVDSRVYDAHSLYLEVPAELGLVGLLALLAFMAGVAGTAARARARAPGAAAAAIAVLVVWALHAGLDWDWEMPAITLPVLLLAGSLAEPAELRDDE